MKLCYHNVLAEETVTVSTEAAGFEKENAYSNRTGDYWKPTAVPAWLKATGRMPVGMWLGSREAGVLTTSELVTDGDMPSTTNWTPLNATLSIVGGALRVTNTLAGVAYVYQQIAAEVGVQQTMTLDIVTDGVTGGVTISAGSSPNSQDYGSNFIATPTPGAYSVNFTPTSGTTYIAMSVTSSALAGEYVDYDNVSVISGGDQDLTINAKPLNVIGTLTRTAVSTGFVWYSGFSSSNYLQQPYNADLNYGVGDFSYSILIKNVGVNEYLFDREIVGGNVNRVAGLISNDGEPFFYTQDNSNISQLIATGVVVSGNTKGQLITFLRRSGVMEIWVDEALVASQSMTVVDLTSTDSATLTVGARHGSYAQACTGSLGLLRSHDYALTPGQITDMANKEKHYDVPGAVLPATYLSTSATTADYFAMYAHDFGQTGSSVVLQYSDDDAAWTNAFAPIFPSSSAPTVKTFTQSSHKYWRVYVDGAVQSMGVCMFGVRLDFQRGLTFGFAPPALAQQFMPRSNVSKQGEFVGRSVTAKPVPSRLSFAPTFTPAWVRQYWPGLIRHMEKKPFFILPQDAYPDEAVFCWSDRLSAPSYPSTMMRIDIPIIAKVA